MKTTNTITIRAPLPAIFAMTGHGHQWGTDVQIWSATSATDPGNRNAQAMPRQASASALAPQTRD